MKILCAYCIFFNQGLAPIKAASFCKPHDEGTWQSEPASVHPTQTFQSFFL